MEKEKKMKMNIWDVDLAKVSSANYCGMLQIIDTRFFFLSDLGIHVVTIHRRAPFRVIDESYQGSCKYPFPKKPHGVAWKLWNTSFIEELNSDGLLFFKKEPKDQFQYLITSGDEWVEFIVNKVEVETLPHKDIHKAFEVFTGKDLKSLKKMTQKAK